MLHDPAIQIAAAQRQAGLAKNLGAAKGLTTVLQTAPPEAQQLGQGGCPPFTAFQGHQ